MKLKRQKIHIGDVVIYICRDFTPIDFKKVDSLQNIYETIYKCEIGVVKRIDRKTNRAAVWYHSGDTASMTNIDDLIKLDNWYQIDTSELGGSRE